jgi:hypothetical protein
MIIITGNMKVISLWLRTRSLATDAAPATKQILIISDPRIFPTANAPSPFLAAVTLVATSGTDVPKATSVIAIIDSEI